MQSRESLAGDHASPSRGTGILENTAPNVEGNVSTCNTNKNTMQYEKGRLYHIQSRNLDLAVFDGDRGMIGIREKFGERYLFTEYLDDGGPFGTVETKPGHEPIALDAVVPENIPVLDRLKGSRDQLTGRAVDFDRPKTEGGRGWYFVDTGETGDDIWPCGIANVELFRWLEEQENMRDWMTRK